jgi:hypothetical protein
VKQCGREGPNVGFPTLTHDRVTVRNWAQNTCYHLPSQLAIMLADASTSILRRIRSAHLDGISNHSIKGEPQEDCFFQRHECFEWQYPCAILSIGVSPNDLRKGFMQKPSRESVFFYFVLARLFMVWTSSATLRSRCS